MNLKLLRQQKQITQQTIANAIGCSVTVYSRYERNEREPSIDMLIRIADYYNISLDILLGREYKINATQLASIDEIEHLTLYRNADIRAREDSNHLLRSHKK